MVLVVVDPCSVLDSVDFLVVDSDCPSCSLVSVVPFVPVSVVVVVVSVLVVL